jgi:hypothetical protein
MQLNGATSESSSIYNSTVDFINRNFKNSQTYKVITVDGVSTDARVVSTDNGLEREVIFRPNTTLNYGLILGIDSENWIVMDYTLDTLSPKAIAKLCNQSINWKDGSNVVKSAYAFTTTNIRYQMNDNSLNLTLPEGTIYVFVKMTDDTNSIKITQRFIIGNHVYEVIGIDDLMLSEGSSGVIKFTMRLTPENVNDDFTTKIADNTILYNKVSGNKPNGDQGGAGDLW